MAAYAIWIWCHRRSSGSACSIAEKISCVSSGRYFRKNPYFSAFLFPGGPVAFLFPGWPPFFLFFERSLFISERSFSHLCVHFHLRTVPSGIFRWLAISTNFCPCFGLFLLEFLTDWQCLLISSLCHIMPWPALLSDLVLLPSLTTSYSSFCKYTKRHPALPDVFLRKM